MTTLSAAPAELPAVSAFPKTFTELCMKVYLPKPIHSRAELRETHRLVSHLAPAAGANRLTRDQSDYFDALCDYIAEYESKHVPPVRKLEPVDMLRSLMEGTGMHQADIARVLDSNVSTVSKIFNKTRPLHTSEVRVLAAHFAISADALI